MQDTWIRPERALVLLAGGYAAWQAVAGLGLLAIAWRHIHDGVLLWAMLGMGFGGPLVLILAAIGRRLEAAERGQRPPAPAWWLVAALGVVLGAHWIALSVWPLALLGAALWTGSSQALDGAWWGIGIWGLAAAGLGIATIGSRARAALVWPAAARPRGRSWLPPSGLIALAYLCSCGATALLGIAWLAEDGWQHEGGAAALLAWSLAGAAAAVGTAGATELWRRRARLGHLATPNTRLEVAGGVLAAHWIPVFLLALTPLVERIPDLRWALLGASVVAVLLGTWLWALGRAHVASAPAA